MCCHPILIRNPNKGSDNLSWYGKDTTSEFIPVPCGHCQECIARKSQSLVQRVQMMSLNHHLFFMTLSYNRNIPRLTTSTGYEYTYADVRDFQDFVRRIRHYNCFTRPFSYFAVSERGSEKGRPHFHVIFCLPKYPEDNWLDIMNLEHIMFDAGLSNWKRNIGSRKFPEYIPLLDYYRVFRNGRINTTYDCHYMADDTSQDAASSVAFYVMKYMLKDVDHDDESDESRDTYSWESKVHSALKLNLPPEEFLEVWSKIRSRCLYSKKFGDPDDPKVMSYIKKCADLSVSTPDNTSFSYFDPSSGQSFPMSRYYIDRPNSPVSLDHKVAQLRKSFQVGEDVFYHADLCDKSKRVFDDRKFKELLRLRSQKGDIFDNLFSENLEN